MIAESKEQTRKHTTKVPGLAIGADGTPLHVDYTVPGRKWFERLVAPDWVRTMNEPAKSGCLERVFLTGAAVATVAAGSREAPDIAGQVQRDLQFSEDRRIVRDVNFGVRSVEAAGPGEVSVEQKVITDPDMDGACPLDNLGRRHKGGDGNPSPCLSKGDVINIYGRQGYWQGECYPYDQEHNLCLLQVDPDGTGNPRFIDPLDVDTSFGEVEVKNEELVTNTDWEYREGKAYEEGRTTGEAVNPVNQRIVETARGRLGICGSEHNADNCGYFVSDVLFDSGVPLAPIRRVWNHWALAERCIDRGIFEWNGPEVNPEPGNIAVFIWEEGGGHVAIVDRVEGDNLWTDDGNISGCSGQREIRKFRQSSELIGFCER